MRWTLQQIKDGYYQLPPHLFTPPHPIQCLECLGICSWERTDNERWTIKEEHAETCSHHEDNQ